MTAFRSEGVVFGICLESLFFRKAARRFAFIDSGSVWRNRALPGEQMHESIGSIGVGARWNYGKSASLRMDLAQVLQATPNRQVNSQRLGAALVVSF